MRETYQAPVGKDKEGQEYYIKAGRSSLSATESFTSNLKSGSIRAVEYIASPRPISTSFAPSLVENTTVRAALESIGDAITTSQFDLYQRVGGELVYDVFNVKAFSPYQKDSSRKRELEYVKRQMATRSTSQFKVTPYMDNLMVHDKTAMAVNKDTGHEVVRLDTQPKVNFRVLGINIFEYGQRDLYIETTHPEVVKENKIVQDAIMKGERIDFEGKYVVTGPAIPKRLKSYAEKARGNIYIASAEIQPFSFEFANAYTGVNNKSESAKIGDDFVAFIQAAITSQKRNREQGKDVNLYVMSGKNFRPRALKGAEKKDRAKVSEYNDILGKLTGLKQDIESAGGTTPTTTDKGGFHYNLSLFEDVNEEGTDVIAVMTKRGTKSDIQERLITITAGPGGIAPQELFDFYKQQYFSHTDEVAKTEYDRGLFSNLFRPTYASLSGSGKNQYLKNVGTVILPTSVDDEFFSTYKNHRPTLYQDYVYALTGKQQSDPEVQQDSSERFRFALYASMDRQMSPGLLRGWGVLANQYINKDIYEEDQGLVGTGLRGIGRFLDTITGYYTMRNIYAAQRGKDISDDPQGLHKDQYTGQEKRGLFESLISNTVNTASATTNALLFYFGFSHTISMIKAETETLGLETITEGHSIDRKAPLRNYFYRRMVSEQHRALFMAVSSAKDIQSLKSSNVLDAILDKSILDSIIDKSDSSQLGLLRNFVNNSDNRQAIELIQSIEDLNDSDSKFVNTVVNSFHHRVRRLHNLEQKKVYNNTAEIAEDIHSIKRDLFGVVDGTLDIESPLYKDKGEAQSGSLSFLNKLRRLDESNFVNVIEPVIRAIAAVDTPDAYSKFEDSIQQLRDVTSRPVSITFKEGGQYAPMRLQNYGKDRMEDIARHLDDISSFIPFNPIYYIPGIRKATGITSTWTPGVDNDDIGPRSDQVVSLKAVLGPGFQGLINLSTNLIRTGKRMFETSPFQVAHEANEVLFLEKQLQRAQPSITAMFSDPRITSGVFDEELADYGKLYARHQNLTAFRSKGINNTIKATHAAAIGRKPLLAIGAVLAVDRVLDKYLMQNTGADLITQLLTRFNNKDKDKDPGTDLSQSEFTPAIPDWLKVPVAAGAMYQGGKIFYSVEMSDPSGVKSLGDSKQILKSYKDANNIDKKLNSQQREQFLNIIRAQKHLLKGRNVTKFNWGAGTTTAIASLFLLQGAFNIAAGVANYINKDYVDKPGMKAGEGAVFSGVMAKSIRKTVDQYNPGDVTDEAMLSTQYIPKNTLAHMSLLGFLSDAAMTPDKGKDRVGYTWAHQQPNPIFQMALISKIDPQGNKFAISAGFQFLPILGMGSIPTLPLSFRIAPVTTKAERIAEAQLAQIGRTGKDEEQTKYRYGNIFDIVPTVFDRDSTLLRAMGLIGTAAAFSNLSSGLEEAGVYKRLTSSAVIRREIDALKPALGWVGTGADTFEKLVRWSQIPQTIMPNVIMKELGAFTGTKSFGFGKGARAITPLALAALISFSAVSKGSEYELLGSQYEANSLFNSKDPYKGLNEANDYRLGTALGLTTIYSYTLYSAGVFSSARSFAKTPMASGVNPFGLRRVQRQMYATYEEEAFDVFTKALKNNDSSALNMLMSGINTQAARQARMSGNADDIARSIVSERVIRSFAQGRFDEAVTDLVREFNPTPARTASAAEQLKKEVNAVLGGVEPKLIRSNAARMKLGSLSLVRTTAVIGFAGLMYNTFVGGRAEGDNAFLSGLLTGPLKVLSGTESSEDSKRLKGARRRLGYKTPFSEASEENFIPNLVNFFTAGLYFDIGKMTASYKDNPNPFMNLIGAWGMSEGSESWRPYVQSQSTGADISTSKVYMNPKMVSSDDAKQLLAVLAGNGGDATTMIRHMRGAVPKKTPSTVYGRTSQSESDALRGSSRELAMAAERREYLAQGLTRQRGSELFMDYFIDMVRNGRVRDPKVGDVRIKGLKYADWSSYDMDASIITQDGEDSYKAPGLLSLIGNTAVTAVRFMNTGSIEPGIADFSTIMSTSKEQSSRSGLISYFSEPFILAFSNRRSVPGEKSRPFLGGGPIIGLAMLATSTAVLATSIFAGMTAITAFAAYGEGGTIKMLEESIVSKVESIKANKVSIQFNKTANAFTVEGGRFTKGGGRLRDSYQPALSPVSFSSGGAKTIDNAYKKLNEDLSDYVMGSTRDGSSLISGLNRLEGLSGAQKTEAIDKIYDTIKQDLKTKLLESRISGGGEAGTSNKSKKLLEYFFETSDESNIGDVVDDLLNKNLVGLKGFMQTEFNSTHLNAQSSYRVIEELANRILDIQDDILTGPIQDPNLSPVLKKAPRKRGATIAARKEARKLLSNKSHHLYGMSTSDRISKVGYLGSTADAAKGFFSLAGRALDIANYYSIYSSVTEAASARTEEQRRTASAAAGYMAVETGVAMLGLGIIRLAFTNPLVGIGAVGVGLGIYYADQKYNEGKGLRATIQTADFIYKKIQKPASELAAKFIYHLTSVPGIQQVLQVAGLPARALDPLFSNIHRNVEGTPWGNVASMLIPENTESWTNRHSKYEKGLVTFQGPVPWETNSRDVRDYWKEKNQQRYARAASTTAGLDDELVNPFLQGRVNGFQEYTSYERYFDTKGYASRVLAPFGPKPYMSNLLRLAATRRNQLGDMLIGAPRRKRINEAQVEASMSTFMSMPLKYLTQVSPDDPKSLQVQLAKTADIVSNVVGKTTSFFLDGAESITSNIFTGVTSAPSRLYNHVTGQISSMRGLGTNTFEEVGTSGTSTSEVGSGVTNALDDTADETARVITNSQKFVKQIKMFPGRLGRGTAAATFTFGLLGAISMIGQTEQQRRKRTDLDTGITFVSSAVGVYATFGRYAVDLFGFTTEGINKRRQARLDKQVQSIAAESNLEEVPFIKARGIGKATVSAGMDYLVKPTVLAALIYSTLQLGKTFAKDAGIKENDYKNTTAGIALGLTGSHVLYKGLTHQQFKRNYLKSAVNGGLDLDALHKVSMGRSLLRATSGALTGGAKGYILSGFLMDRYADVTGQDKTSDEFRQKRNEVQIAAAKGFAIYDAAKYISKKDIFAFRTGFVDQRNLFQRTVDDIVHPRWGEVALGLSGKAARGVGGLLLSAVNKLVKGLDWFISRKEQFLGEPPTPTRTVDEAIEAFKQSRFSWLSKFRAANAERLINTYNRISLTILDIGDSRAFRFGQSVVGGVIRGTAQSAFDLGLTYLAVNKLESLNKYSDREEYRAATKNVVNLLPGTILGAFSQRIGLGSLISISQIFQNGIGELLGQSLGDKFYDERAQKGKGFLAGVQQSLYKVAGAMPGLDMLFPPAAQADGGEQSSNLTSRDILTAGVTGVTLGMTGFVTVRAGMNVAARRAAEAAAKRAAANSIIFYNTLAAKTSASPAELAAAKRYAFKSLSMAPKTAVKSPSAFGRAVGAVARGVFKKLETVANIVTIPIVGYLNAQEATNIRNGSGNSTKESYQRMFRRNMSSMIASSAPYIPGGHWVTVPLTILSDVTNAFGMGDHYYERTWKIGLTRREDRAQLAESISRGGLIGGGIGGTIGGIIGAVKGGPDGAAAGYNTGQYLGGVIGAETYLWNKEEDHSEAMGMLGKHIIAIGAVGLGIKLMGNFAKTLKKEAETFTESKKLGEADREKAKAEAAEQRELQNQAEKARLEEQERKRIEQEQQSESNRLQEEKDRLQAEENLKAEVERQRQEGEKQQRPSNPYEDQYSKLSLDELRQELGKVDRLIDGSEDVGKLGIMRDVLNSLIDDRIRSRRKAIIGKSEKSKTTEEPNPQTTKLSNTSYNSTLLTPQKSSEKQATEYDAPIVSKESSVQENQVQKEAAAERIQKSQPTTVVEPTAPTPPKEFSPQERRARNSRNKLGDLADPKNRALLKQEFQKQWRKQRGLGWDNTPLAQSVINSEVEDIRSGAPFEESNFSRLAEYMATLKVAKKNEKRKVARNSIPLTGSPIKPKKRLSFLDKLRDFVGLSDEGDEGFLKIGDRDEQGTTQRNRRIGQGKGKAIDYQMFIADSVAEKARTSAKQFGKAAASNGVLTRFGKNLSSELSLKGIVKGNFTTFSLLGTGVAIAEDIYVKKTDPLKAIGKEAVNALLGGLVFAGAGALFGAMAASSVPLVAAAGTAATTGMMAYGVFTISQQLFNIGSEYYQSEILKRRFTDKEKQQFSTSSNYGSLRATKNASVMTAKGMHSAYTQARKGIARSSTLATVVRPEEYKHIAKTSAGAKNVNKIVRGTKAAASVLDEVFLAYEGYESVKDILTAKDAKGKEAGQIRLSRAVGGYIGGKIGSAIGRAPGEAVTKLSTVLGFQALASIGIGLTVAGDAVGGYVGYEIGSSVAERMYENVKELSSYFDKEDKSIKNREGLDRKKRETKSKGSKFAEEYKRYTDRLKKASEGPVASILDFFGQVVKTIHSGLKAYSNFKKLVFDKAAETLSELSQGAADAVSRLLGANSLNPQEQFISTYLAAKGFTKAGIAAVLGSFKQESGLSPHARENGGRGAGRGLAQWTNGARRANMPAITGDLEKDTVNQLNYFLEELNGRNGEGRGGKILKVLTSTEDIDAAMAAMKAYERYGVAGRRYTYAKEYMRKFDLQESQGAGGGVDGAIFRTGNTGTGTGAHLDIRGKNKDGSVMSEKRLRELAQYLYVGDEKLVNKYPQTSGYGRRDIGIGSKNHLAIDYGTPVGTLVSIKGLDIAKIGDPFFDKKGGGWVRRVTLKSGETLSFLHGSKDQPTNYRIVPVTQNSSASGSTTGGSNAGADFKGPRGRQPAIGGGKVTEKYRTGTLKAQEYGAGRKGGRSHAGQDLDISGNQQAQSFLGGVVTRVVINPNGGGYGSYVDIYNPKLKVVERFAEMLRVNVKVGDVISAGQAVGGGESGTGVIHYEIRTDVNSKGQGGYGYKGTVSPITYLSRLGLVRRIGTRIEIIGGRGGTTAVAEEHHDNDGHDHGPKQKSNKTDSKGKSPKPAKPTNKYNAVPIPTNRNFTVVPLTQSSTNTTTRSAPSNNKVEWKKGQVSFYGQGDGFAGRRTASGEIMNPNLLTAATLLTKSGRAIPYGSMVEVKNNQNGKTVIVRINDTGPLKPGRVLDLSPAAFKKIGDINQGILRDVSYRVISGPPKKKDRRRASNNVSNLVAQNTPETSSKKDSAYSVYDGVVSDSSPSPVLKDTTGEVLVAGNPSQSIESSTNQQSSTPIKQIAPSVKRPTNFVPEGMEDVQEVLDNRKVKTPSGYKHRGPYWSQPGHRPPSTMGGYTGKPPAGWKEGGGFTDRPPEGWYPRNRKPTWGELGHRPKEKPGPVWGQPGHRPKEKSGPTWGQPGHRPEQIEVPQEYIPPEHRPKPRPDVYQNEKNRKNEPWDIIPHRVPGAGSILDRPKHDPNDFSKLEGKKVGDPDDFSKLEGKKKQDNTPLWGDKKSRENEVLWGKAESVLTETKESRQKDKERIERERKVRIVVVEAGLPADYIKVIVNAQNVHDKKKKELEERVKNVKRPKGNYAVPPPTDRGNAANYPSADPNNVANVATPFKRTADVYTEESPEGQGKTVTVIKINREEDPSAVLYQAVQIMPPIEWDIALMEPQMSASDSKPSGDKDIFGRYMGYE